MNLPLLSSALRRSSCLLVGLMVVGRASAGLLHSTDFNHGQEGDAVTYGNPEAKLAVTAHGTIDAFQGQPSQALALEVDFSRVQGEPARAGVSLGKQRVTNTETHLAKLTLSCDLWVSTIRPVRVRIESYDATGKSTGSRSARVIPPVAESFYRFSLDLDKMRPHAGEFDPRAPEVQVSFELNDADGAAPLSRTGRYLLRIDNLSYASPAYYVSVRGNDEADGRTETTAFATLQRGMDAAQAGDVILVMDGTYSNTTKPDISDVPLETVNAPVWRPWWVKNSGSICRVAKAGRPDAWIVVRAHPGHRPRVFNVTGWEAFKIDLGAAYFELRDMILEGNGAALDRGEALADGAITQRDGWRYYGDPRFNNNGVMADGRATQDPSQRAHHLRFINNTIFDCPAAGISAIGTDHVTVEGNTIHDNVHFTRWGTSGISYLRPFNYDGFTGQKNFVVRNRTYGNRCYVPWVRYGKDAQGRTLLDAAAAEFFISDGNGIIIDVSRRRGIPTEGTTDQDYQGRTLVSNNLSYGNGAGGIVLTTVQHVDVINNTLYGNVQSPELVKKGWGDLFLGGPPPSSGDIIVINNLVQTVGAPASLRIHPVTKPQPLLIKNNLFHGALVDEGDWPQVGTLTADPLFEKASLDPAVADFRLRAASPAIGAGSNTPHRIIPADDLDGRLRPPGPATLGALAPEIMDGGAR